MILNSAERRHYPCLLLTETQDTADRPPPLRLRRRYDGVVGDSGRAEPFDGPPPLLGRHSRRGR